MRELIRHSQSIKSIAPNLVRHKATIQIFTEDETKGVVKNGVWNRLSKLDFKSRNMWWLSSRVRQQWSRDWSHFKGGAI